MKMTALLRRDVHRGSKGKNMKKIASISIVIAFTVLQFCGSVSYAQEPNSLVRSVSYALDKMDMLSYFTQPLKQKLSERKIDLDFFGALIQGVDNNIFLDPSRTRDAFVETSVSSDITYNYSNDIRLAFDVYASNIIYYRFNDNNLLDISLEPGFEIDFFDDYLRLSGAYMLDWTYFPHDETGSYIAHQASSFLRHNVIENFYHKAGLKLEYRNYTNRKAYDIQNEGTQNLRSDERVTGEYEAVFYLWGFIKLKENFQVYHNVSNDHYQDYYDYDAYRSKTTLIVFFTDKFYGMTSFAYTRKLFEERQTTESSMRQRDRLYYYNLSLLYELTPSFTLATDFSYRENTSNEPTEKYSGSILSIGLYYTF